MQSAVHFVFMNAFTLLCPLLNAVLVVLLMMREEIGSLQGIFVFNHRACLEKNAIDFWLIFLLEIENA